MKSRGFGQIVWAIAAASSLIQAPLRAQNNDVYNFYFQKGSAPQTVIQGAQGQQSADSRANSPQPTPLPNNVNPTPPPAGAASAENSSVAKVAPTSSPDEFNAKSFNVLMGVTNITDEVGSGTHYALGGQYNFNKYLGARLTATLIAIESATYERKLRNRDEGANRWGGSAALAFTPLHLQLMGHSFLQLSALGGVMSQRKFAERWDDPTGQGNNFPAEVRTSVRGFVGAAARLTLNPNTAIEASVAMLDGGKVGQAGGALVLAF